MSRKTDPLDRLYDLDVKRAAVLIFTIAFVFRAVLNLMFFERFGYRSVQYLETWFYYGVAREKLQLMSLDPTGPLLRASGAIFSDNSLVYGIILLAIVLSSLTAVLIFLLARELHDSRTGVIAGLFYAVLLSPSLMTMAGFTHDIVAVPIIVLLMYLAVLAGKASRKKRMLLMFLLIAIGANVNPMIIFGIFAVLVYFVMQKYGDDGNYRNNILWIAAIAVLIRILLYGEIMEYIAGLALEHRGIDLLTQMQYSKDLAMPDLEVLATTYNFLWLLVPFGIITALKKKDTMSLSLFLAGILAISAFSKGTRVLDIGMCVIAAVGFVNLGKYHAVAKSINLEKYREYGLHLLAAFVLANLAIASYYSAPGFTQTEYEMFKWLEANTEQGETLYAKWTYGYTLQALSGLQPVSTPERIRPDIYQILWTDDEAKMAEGLTLLGAKYVLVSEEDFFYYESPSRFWVMAKESIFPPEELKYADEATLPAIRATMIYQFLYGEPEHFTLLNEWKDPAKNARYRVYELKFS